MTSVTGGEMIDLGESGRTETRLTAADSSCFSDGCSLAQDAPAHSAARCFELCFEALEGRKHQLAVVDGNQPFGLEAAKIA